MNMFRGPAAALVLLGASGASAGCVVGRLAELPVTMFELRPTVHAKVNGSDVRLLTDSGAFFSMISPGTAAELKLPNRPAPLGFYVKGVGGLTSVSFTTVKDFTLDTIPLHNIDFIVGGSEMRQGIAGILGRNVLGYADAEYDLGNSIIRLMRPSGCGNRPLAYWAQGKPINTLVIESQPQLRPAITAPINVNGVRLKATFDTGASTSVLMLSAAKRAGVPVAGSDLSEKGMSGGIGRRMVEDFVAPLGSIKIGDEEIRNTKIRVIDSSLTDSDMLLGADFFLSHRVYVANSQKKIYFTYNGGPVFSLIAKPIDAEASPPLTAPLADVKAADAKTAEPTDAAGFSRRGEAYASRRDFAHAIVDLDRAMALAPMEPDYPYQRAVVRLSAGQVFLAMSDVEQSLKLRPGDPGALVLRAQLRFAGHQKSEAVADLDAVAKTASPMADVRLNLAGLYSLGDRLDSAVEQYSLWIAAHPDDNRRPIALNGRCWTRALLNRDLDKALTDCNSAVRANLKAYGSLDSRGLVFFRRGEFAKAIADYNASLSLRPKIAWSLYGRGLAKMKSGDTEGAKTDIAAALASNPNIATEAAKYGLMPSAISLPPAP